MLFDNSVVAGVIQATGVAVSSMAEAAEGLSVDTKKMRSNIAATNGLIFAERAMMLLGSKMGRDTAHNILQAATKRSLSEGRNLAAVLADTPEVARHLKPAELKQLEVPENYLGSTETFRSSLAADSANDDTKER